MGNWQLFVDESGDFEQDGDQGVVGGLLVRGILGPRDEDALRQHLMERVYPWTTYPPHAVALNHAASRPAFDVWLTEFAGRAPQVEVEKLAKRLAGDASRLLRENPSGHPSLAELYRLASTGEGTWEPPTRRTVGAMITATSALRNSTDQSERDLFYSLEKKLVHPQDQTIRRLCASVATPLRRSLFAVPVFAWGRAIIVDGTPLGGVDPYAARLQMLFERVAGVVGAHPGHHVIYLHVAHRPLKVEGLTGLSASRIKQMFAQAASDAGGGHRIAGAAAAPPSNDSDVHSGISLADFLVNHVNKRVLHRTTADSPLDHVVDEAMKYTGMRPSLTVSVDGVRHHLPTIAVEGPSQTAIRDGRPLPAAPGWEREQAEAWIKARAAMRVAGLIQ